MTETSILLIDDDPSINFLNKLVIERAEVGAEVSEITEPQEALRQLEDGSIKPSLIFLDINMPIMNGWEFASSYEKLPNSSPNIILLTSSINPSDKDMASSREIISGFYSKPLTVENVKEIAQLYLNQ